MKGTTALPHASQRCRSGTSDRLAGMNHLVEHPEQTKRRSMWISSA
jgi:hypothetical protein